MMIIYFEYEIVYNRQHMTELSIYDICNVPIAILINFLFLFSFFFLLTVEMFCVM